MPVASTTARPRCRPRRRSARAVLSCAGAAPAGGSSAERSNRLGFSPTAAPAQHAKSRGGFVRRRPHRSTAPLRPERASFDHPPIAGLPGPGPAPLARHSRRKHGTMVVLAASIVTKTGKGARRPPGAAVAPLGPARPPGARPTRCDARCRSPGLEAVHGHEPHQDRGPAGGLPQAGGHRQAAHIRRDGERPIRVPADGGGPRRAAPAPVCPPGGR
jgi:hypothetical protein